MSTPRRSRRSDPEKSLRSLEEFVKPLPRKGTHPTCSDFGPDREIKFAGQGFYFCDNCIFWEVHGVPGKKHLKRSKKYTCLAKHTNWNFPTQKIGENVIDEEKAETAAEDGKESEHRLNNEAKVKRNDRKSAVGPKYREERVEGLQTLQSSSKMRQQNEIERNIETSPKINKSDSLKSVRREDYMQSNALRVKKRAKNLILDSSTNNNNIESRGTSENLRASPSARHKSKVSTHSHGKSVRKKDSEICIESHTPREKKRAKNLRLEENAFSSTKNDNIDSRGTSENLRASPSVRHKSKVSTQSHSNSRERNPQLKRRSSGESDTVITSKEKPRKRPKVIAGSIDGNGITLKTNEANTSKKVPFLSPQLINECNSNGELQLKNPQCSKPTTKNRNEKNMTLQKNGTKTSAVRTPLSHDNVNNPKLSQEKTIRSKTKCRKAKDIDTGLITLHEDPSVQGQLSKDRPCEEKKTSINYFRKDSVIQMQKPWNHYDRCKDIGDSNSTLELEPHCDNRRSIDSSAKNPRIIKAKDNRRNWASPQTRRNRFIRSIETHTSRKTHQNGMWKELSLLIPKLPYGEEGEHDLISAILSASTYECDPLDEGHPKQMNKDEKESKSLNEDLKRVICMFKALIQHHENAENNIDNAAQNQTRESVPQEGATFIPWNVIFRLCFLTLRFCQSEGDRFQFPATIGKRSYDKVSRKSYSLKQNNFIEESERLANEFHKTVGMLFNQIYSELCMYLNFFQSDQQDSETYNAFPLLLSSGKMCRKDWKDTREEVFETCRNDLMLKDWLHLSSKATGDTSWKARCFNFGMARQNCIDDVGALTGNIITNREFVDYLQSKQMHGSFEVSPSLKYTWINKENEQIILQIFRNIDQILQISLTASNENQLNGMTDCNRIDSKINKKRIQSEDNIHHIVQLSREHQYPEPPKRGMIPSPSKNYAIFQKLKKIRFSTNKMMDAKKEVSKNTLSDNCTDNNVSDRSTQSYSAGNKTKYSMSTCLDLKKKENSINPIPTNTIDDEGLLLSDAFAIAVDYASCHCSRERIQKAILSIKKGSPNNNENESNDGHHYLTNLLSSLLGSALGVNYCNITYMNNSGGIHAEDRFKRGRALLISYLIHIKVSGFEEAQAILKPSPIKLFLRTHDIIDRFNQEHCNEITDVISPETLPDRTKANFDDSQSLLPHKKILTQNLDQMEPTTIDYLHTDSDEFVSDFRLEMCIRQFLNGVLVGATPHESEAIFRNFIYRKSQVSCIPNVYSLVLDLFDLVIHFSLSSVNEAFSCRGDNFTHFLQVVSKFSSWLPFEPLVARLQVLLKLIFIENVNNGEAEKSNEDYRSLAEGYKDAWAKKISTCISKLSISTKGRLLLNAIAFVQTASSVFDREGTVLDEKESRCCRTEYCGERTKEKASCWSHIFDSEICNQVLMPLVWRCSATLSSIPKKNDDFALVRWRCFASLKILFSSIVEFIYMNFQKCNASKRSIEATYLGLGRELRKVIFYFVDFFQFPSEIMLDEDPELKAISESLHKSHYKMKNIHRAISSLYLHGVPLVQPLPSQLALVKNLTFASTAAYSLPFDIFASQIISFAFSPNWEKTEAHSWCNYVGNVLVHRYCEIDQNHSKEDKIMKLLFQWVNILNDILVCNFNNGNKKFPSFLKYIHEHVLSSLLKQDSWDFHHKHPQGETVVSKMIYPGRLFFVNLLKDLKDEANERIQAIDKKVNLACLSIILCNTPAQLLFYRKNYQTLHGRSDCEHKFIQIVKEMLASFGRTHLSVGTHLLIGLGHFMEESFKWKLNTKNDFEYCAISDVIAGFLHERLINDSAWSRALEMVQSELSCSGASKGSNWWIELLKANKLDPYRDSTSTACSKEYCIGTVEGFLSDTMKNFVASCNGEKTPTLPLIPLRIEATSNAQPMYTHSNINDFNKLPDQNIQSRPSRRGSSHPKTTRVVSAASVSTVLNELLSSIN